jgi:hypothetical protein
MVRGMLVSALWLGVLAPADRLIRLPSPPASRLVRLRRGLPAPDAPAAPDAADCRAEDSEDDPSGDPPSHPATANPDAAHGPSRRRRTGLPSSHAPPPPLIYAHCTLLL